ncbi:MAG: hypothetical protein HYU66_11625, partial [Armatimonadetes bacterium]|nr:hypothetical protein [Armatimonadota bacterium]
LAVGMASVFEKALPWLEGLVSYWYHFVIMFEALFILTLLETGTRVARFVFQETYAQINPKAMMGGKPANWGMNVGMSALVCFGWGYLLYTGSFDALWRMLGIANQLLANIALVVGTTYLMLHAPKRSYALLTFVPLVFLFVTTLYAGWLSIGMWSKQIPVLAAEHPEQVFTARLVCWLCGIMLVLTAVIAVDAVRRWLEILRSPRETPLGDPEMDDVTG